MRMSHTHRPPYAISVYKWSIRVIVWINLLNNNRFDSLLKMQLNRSEPLNLVKSSHGKAESNGYSEPKCKDCNSDYCVVRKFYEYQGTNIANASNKTNKLNKYNNVQDKKLTKEFVCHICFNRFARLGSLRAHACLHSNTTPEHICKYCSKSFRWKSNLRVHYAMRNREKMVCETCKKILPIDKIEQHRNQHLDQSLQCQYCEKAYSNKYKVNYHIRSKHPQVNAWQCQYCTESFKKANERRAHIYNQHHKEEIQCHQCQKTFTTQQSLQKHQSIHDTAFEPFQCEICGQLFSLKRNLYSHIMRHIRNGNGTLTNTLQKRIHVCKICNQLFRCKLDAFNCKHDTKPAACQYDKRRGNTSTSEFTVQIGLVSQFNAEGLIIPLFDVNIPKSNVEASNPIDTRLLETNAQKEPILLVQTSTRRSTFDDCIETSGHHGSLDISAQHSGGRCATIHSDTIVIDDTDSCSYNENVIIDYSLPKIYPKINDIY